MPDREKIIAMFELYRTGIEHCLSDQLIDDTINLLKEQEWRRNGMADREKVIRSIVRCVIKKGNCHECDYYTQTEQEMSCRNRMLMDALTLLKEQEEKEQLVEVVRCKDCEHLLFPMNGVPFCKHIKNFVDDNWFCADGKRKEVNG